MKLVEDIITAHNTSEPLDNKAKQQFHLVLWRQASFAYEGSEFNKALSWYNYSLSLFPAQGDKDSNIAKLQRNRASCHLNLKDYESAGESIKSAKHHSSNSSQTHFLAFKLALLKGEQEGAVECLDSLAGSTGDDEQVITGLISLAAQLAFEQSNRDLAVTVLEKLIECNASTCQVFTAIRCLLRIKLTLMDANPQNKLSSLRVMLKYLCQAKSLIPSITASSSKQNEANWLLKVAWNLALQCNHCHKEMADFFVICYQLSATLPSDESVLRRQRSCQLMAAAAFVQVAKATDNQQEKEEAMQAVLDHVSTCRSISQQLGGGDIGAPKDPVPSLLVLYEFEANLLLNQHELHGLLQRALHIPSVEAKTLETIVALCVCTQGSDESINVAVEALHAAITLYSRSPEVNGEQLSRCYHSLVQLVMGSREETTAVRGEQGEGWNLFSQILDLLESKVKGSFPEIEVVWFLSKAWNHGIHFYSSLKFKLAEQWCSLGMRFLKHLTQHKEGYEEQMSRTYSEVLQKVQSGHRYI